MVQPLTSITGSVDDQLRDVLSRFSVVQLAILFGSVASGRARPDSDLDLGIVCARPISVDEKISIIQALAEKFGRPVDLVDLYPAPEPLLGQVLRHGRRIIGSDEAFGRLLYRHLIEQADFMPIKNRILKERRMAWIGK
nr:nucleotidyltransferase domain-containing protein [uncultured Limnohabitans sp.]